MLVKRRVKWEAGTTGDDVHAVALEVHLGKKGDTLSIKAQDEYAI